MCTCESGYRSNNVNSGAVISEMGDICIRCRSAIECGYVPTSSPTATPSISSKPTGQPSFSLVPSDKPSVSFLPTLQPTTAAPTNVPSMSQVPSMLPSSQPSKFFSSFDGDRCRFDIECRSLTCVTNSCKSKSVSQINLCLFPI